MISNIVFSPFWTDPSCSAIYSSPLSAIYIRSSHSNRIQNCWCVRVAITCALSLDFIHWSAASLRSDSASASGVCVFFHSNHCLMNTARTVLMSLLTSPSRISGFGVKPSSSSSSARGAARASGAAAAASFPSLFPAASCPSGG